MNERKSDPDIPYFYALLLRNVKSPRESGRFCEIQVKLIGVLLFFNGRRAGMEGSDLISN